MASSVWATNQTYVDDNGDWRVFHLLPSEVEECHEPPPNDAPMVPARQEAPSVPHYVPEPATPPGPSEDRLTDAAIQAKFAALGIAHRMGSKKGEIRGSGYTEPRGQWTKEAEAESDAEHIPSKSAVSKSAPARKRKGRPAKKRAEKRVFDLDEWSGKEEYRVVAGSDEDVAGGEDEEEAVGSVSVQQAKGKKVVIDLVSGDDKENAPPMKARPAKRRRSNATSRNTTVRQSDAVLDEAVLDDPETSLASGRPRRLQRNLPVVSYTDLTPQEAEGLLKRDQF